VIITVAAVIGVRMIGRPSLSTMEMTHGQPSAFALAAGRPPR
jgi:hypothetical protein